MVEVSEAEAAKKALEGLGFGITLLQASPERRPEAGKVAEYPLVVWVLPPDWSSHWPESQRKMLRSCVEQGGRLMLIASTPNQQPLAESSTFGKGKASFVSGDLGRMGLEQQAQVLQNLIQQLLR